MIASWPNGSSMRPGECSSSSTPLWEVESIAPGDWHSGKRFCVTFDFELQAAATDDGIVLSLGEQHSFPLESIFSYVLASTVKKDLVQAMLAAPLFTSRWRWNASRALAVLRFNGGRRVPMAIQRMRAEDLLAAVFPQQVMCQDNRTGPIELPDHPLVNETIQNCLHEAMDLEGLCEVLAKIEQGQISTVAVETSAPSSMAHEILNANPYAFLDDAPWRSAGPGRWLLEG